MCRLIKTRPSNLCPKRDLRNLEMPAKYQNYQELKASNQFQIKGKVYSKQFMKLSFKLLLLNVRMPLFLIPVNIDTFGIYLTIKQKNTNDSKCFQTPLRSSTPLSLPTSKDFLQKNSSHPLATSYFNSPSPPTIFYIGNI